MSQDKSKEELEQMVIALDIRVKRLEELMMSMPNPNKFIQHDEKK